MLGLERISRGLSDIIYVCCNPEARKLLDNAEFIARLAKDTPLLEHPDLIAKASKLPGQPPTDILAKGK